MNGLRVPRQRVALANGHAATPNGAQPGRRPVLARMMKPEINTDDTPGIDTLLERDYKEIDLVEDAFGLGPSPSAAAPVAGPATTSAEASAGKQRRAELRAEPEGPRRSREAIDAGLDLFQQGKYQAAADLFQLALELPGSGYLRMAGSPKEYACASPGEENAALYNMACCYCKLGKPEAALTCLEALVDNGFEDLASVRTDPDLAPARGPQLDKILAQRDGLFGKLFGGKKDSATSNKPWIQW